MSKPISPHLIRQLFALLAVVLLGFIILAKLQTYLSGILGAITLYVILRKPMKKLLSLGWPKTLAAIVLIVLSIFAV